MPYLATLSDATRFMATSWDRDAVSADFMRLAA
jgi:hypothetical protein